MKTTYSLLCSVVCAVAITITASAPQASFAADFGSTSSNPYDWFKLGETEWALRYGAYYRAISDSLQDKLREHETLMKKLDVPSEVLSAFSALAQAAMALPFSKDFNEWTQADMQRMKSELWPPERKLTDALRAYVSKDKQRTFFYWLGLQSLRLGWSIPTLDMRTYGYTLAEEMPEITNCITDLADFNRSTWSDITTTLTPEARDALKTIAGIAAKTNDPLGGGLTQADLDKMVAAAQTIRQLARDNKLVGSQGPTSKF